MGNRVVLLLQDQIALDRLETGQRSNVAAVLEYEQAIFQLTQNSADILDAYPHESDSGIYVAAMNGRVVTANNRRGVIKYLDYLGHSAEGMIFVHKLGCAVDFDCHKKLMTAAMA